MRRERPSSSGLRRGPHDWPAGLRVLVPGLAQWGWRQPERALVLFGSFASALGAGLLAWGTWGGLLLLVFAFGTHVTSTADVIRQGAFPGFGRLVPWATASAGLGLGCYAPALLLATVLAWPGASAGGGPAADGYLVNRWAYDHREPVAGHWAWIDAGNGQPPRVARVLAGPGQAVSWTENRIRIDGKPPAFPVAEAAGRPFEVAFEVPAGFLLVSDGGPPAAGVEGLRLVARREVEGRAWARLYPVWDRRFLP